jgi:hypothetical protein
MFMRSAAEFFCVLTSVAGCSTVASKTNMLTDDSIKSDTGGVLGLSPKQLTIVERRTEGTNTFVQLKANTGQEYACTINGGNLLTFGMVNPPMCAKKSEPIKVSPFSK